MDEEKKSYFFVFSEEEACSELENRLDDAFKRFRAVHDKDSEVVLLTPRDSRFEKARTQFDIKRLPAFTLADEPFKIEKGGNPYISFERGVIERFQDESLFYLITDIHYLLKDENLLRIKQREIMRKLAYMFKVGWNEIVQLLNISL